MMESDHKTIVASLRALIGDYDCKIAKHSDNLQRLKKVKAAAVELLEEEIRRLDLNAQEKGMEEKQR